MHATPGDTFDVIGGSIVFPSGRAGYDPRKIPSDSHFPTRFPR